MSGPAKVRGAAQDDTEFQIETTADLAGAGDNEQRASRNESSAIDRAPFRAGPALPT
jgi:hypothetical protein